jgi:hypothetical protein
VDVKKRLTEDAASFAEEVEEVDATAALVELLSRLGISPEHLTSTEPVDGRCGNIGHQPGSVPEWRQPNRH